MTLQSELAADRLKALAANSGPCISIYFPIHRRTEDPAPPAVRFKRALAEFEKALPAKGIVSEEASKMLVPVNNLVDTVTSPQAAGKTLVVLCSAEFMRHFLVDHELPEYFTASAHFYVRPILPELRKNRTFYILALSKKNTRLLRCNDTESEQVELGENAPRSFDEFLRSGVGGAMAQGAIFTSATDHDNLESHLGNFYRAVNHAVVEVLKDSGPPLVLAGVEYEIPIYRKVNTYRDLVQAPVLGAPDGLKAGELHKRALEVTEKHRHKPLEHALQQYEQNAPTRASIIARQITRAAHDGRVLYLMVAKATQLTGRFDELTQEEDLINAAALETLTHSGEVFVCPPEQVPGRARMAAVFRW
jgi:hypothetical protein